MPDAEDPNDKKPDGDVTRVINPATDTLKIDLELAKATDPVLILIRGTPQGKKYSLKGAKKFVMGRDKVADIQLDDANVSRQHSMLTFEEDKIFIEDMGSRNGTFLNDEPIGSAKIELAKEDMIKLGSTILKYLPAGQLETLYHINLTNAASMDKLTGLYNRKYISEVLEVEFKRAKALHSNISVILFDIDNFKKVNDTYGHDGGDYVLTTLGAQVKASGLRERDLAGRYGGEEFIVVLTNSTSQQAADVAERIRKRIEQCDFTYDGKKIPVTISLGVASIQKEFHLGADIYKEADKALYVSKRSGKNKVTIAGGPPDSGTPAT
jgi:two-component system cell cycle response regulator